ncbi:MAG: haloacid dehalogenase type II [Gammaproteobacteria bacterium]|nr:haloacid dehalogenase type II [Gammaproteobacteria bacterium]
MSFTRREFLSLAAAGVAAGVLVSTPSAHAETTPKIKAIAFDAFPIFDPRPVFALAEQLFPGKGTELSNAWRTRQFEYQWLRALSGNYADFWQATEESLMFAAELLKLDLTPDKRKLLMEAYLRLKAWPDVPLALKSLKSAGIRLAFLSNATPKILDSGIKNSRLEGVFEHILSTDKIKTYKPDSRAYQMAIDAFGLKKEEILFGAFAGWDAAGAKSFGYTTFWVNRLNLPAERLGASPDAVGQNLNDLVAYVKARQ